MNIKKAIIPAGGLGTRFLPLSKVVSKELLPLVDEPMIAHIVREVIESGINDISFVVPPNKKDTADYYKKNTALENSLKKNNKKELLSILEKISKETENVSFSSIIQPMPKGDGDAVLKAEKHIGNEPFAVAFCDDVFESKKPALAQLKKIFETSQNPVIGLKKVTQDKVAFYGTAKVEKIAHRLYKIKDIIEKPKPDEAPSDLVFCGRYIFTPEIFKYIGMTKPNEKGETILAESLKLMLGDGKMIYGYELEGEWLECGKKIDWLKSNFYLCLRHPKYGPILKEYLKKTKIK
ncbi:MAG: UTP--glucose-1-phosphate uridylyltransferase [Parcubacteria group bacterium]|nr:UTP--glucose-1-phosphate uridylyltransferase [Parcubacteria group bacterium]